MRAVSLVRRVVAASVFLSKNVSTKAVHACVAPAVPFGLAGVISAGAMVSVGRAALARPCRAGLGRASAIRGLFPLRAVQRTFLHCTLLAPLLQPAPQDSEIPV